MAAAHARSLLSARSFCSVARLSPRLVHCRVAVHVPHQLQQPQKQHQQQQQQLLQRRGMVTVRGIEVTPKRVGYAALGLTGTYFLLDGLYYFFKFYADLTIFDLGEIGFFAGGILFSAAFVGTYIATRRYGTPQPDTMAKAVVRRLRQDPMVIERLGQTINMGDFRAYAYKGGLSWSGYQPKRLQMILQLKGSKDSGVVSFDVYRSWREGLVYRSLCVDVNSSGERLLYAGSTEDIIFRGTIHLLS